MFSVVAFSYHLLPSQRALSSNCGDNSESSFAAALRQVEEMAL